MQQPADPGRRQAVVDEHEKHEHKRHETQATDKKAGTSCTKHSHLKSETEHPGDDDRSLT